MFNMISFTVHYHSPRSRDSSFGIATGWTALVRFPAVQDFSLLHSAQTGSGAQWLPGAISQGVNRQGHEADHSPPSSAEVKKGGAIPPLPHMSSWHSTELIKHRNTFTFFLPFITPPQTATVTICLLKNQAVSLVK
jgi:hypothetical protein